jgi:hypothetical protein
MGIIAASASSDELYNEGNAHVIPTTIKVSIVEITRVNKRLDVRSSFSLSELRLSSEIRLIRLLFNPKANTVERIE